MDSLDNSEENYHILLIINHDLTQIERLRNEENPEKRRNKNKTNKQQQQRRRRRRRRQEQNQQNKKPCFRETGDHNSTQSIKLFDVINIWMI